jgi:hypothetical protein
VIGRCQGLAQSYAELLGEDPDHVLNANLVAPDDHVVVLALADTLPALCAVDLDDEVGEAVQRGSGVRSAHVIRYGVWIVPGSDAAVVEAGVVGEARSEQCPVAAVDPRCVPPARR